MSLRKVKTKDGGFVYHTRHFYRGQRSKQLTTHTAIRREADRIDKERQQAFEKAIDHPSSGPSDHTPLTLDLLYKFYIEYGRRRGRDETYIDQTLHTYFHKWLPLYPWNLTAVTQEDKYRYIDLRRPMLTNTGRPTMYRTICKELSALSQGLKIAGQKGYALNLDSRIPEVPNEPLCDNHRGHYYPVKTLNRWRECIRSRQADYAYIMLLTGIRSSEFRKFSLGMLRTDSEEPTEGIAAYAELPGEITKSGRPRMIAITQSVYEAMQRAFPLKHTNWREAFQGAAKRARTPIPTERDLRHNFAEVAGLRGGEDTTIDMAMGHNSTTMRRRYQSAHDLRMAGIALYVEGRFLKPTLDNVRPIRPLVEGKWNLALLKRKEENG